MEKLSKAQETALKRIIESVMTSRKWLKQNNTFGLWKLFQTTWRIDRMSEKEQRKHFEDDLQYHTDKANGKVYVCFINKRTIEKLVKLGYLNSCQGTLNNDEIVDVNFEKCGIDKN